MSNSKLGNEGHTLESSQANERVLKQDIATLRARVAELEATSEHRYKWAMAVQGKWGDAEEELELAEQERDQLKARVAELEAEAHGRHEAVVKARKERDQLRAELNAVSEAALNHRDAELRYKSERDGWRDLVTKLEAELDERQVLLMEWKNKTVEAQWEIIRLKDELEALKPTPDVVYEYLAVGCGGPYCVTETPEDGVNIKLTFTDGKLTGAEVIE